MTASGEAQDIQHWADVAEDWIAWARAKGHDAYWAYEHAFQDLVGEGQVQGLEIGCGEGRVARSLTDLGYRMTIVDPVAAMLTAARDAVSADTYIEAPGHALPLKDASFSLVVLYNVLMDVDALDATLAEATRVLRPGGRMIVGLVHPIADLLLSFEKTGSRQGGDSYFTARQFDDTDTGAGGLSMRFRGWARPLSAYTDALGKQALQITRIVEPEPDPNHQWSANSRWRRQPLFLWIEATKPASVIPSR